MGRIQQAIARNMEHADHVNLHAAKAMIYHDDIRQAGEADRRDMAILEWRNAAGDA